MARFISFSMLLILATPAYAWGEMGHDIVARVAVRLVAERAPAAMAKPFLMKEHMMGHLANVPDIVWRSSSEKDAKAFNPQTHYVDFEYLQADTGKIDPVRLPHDLKTYIEMMRSNCVTSKENCAPGKSAKEMLSKAGTAPLRIGQLAERMRKALADGKALPNKKAKGRKDSPFENHVNEALLNAGIMAHFVGDLTNPMHTTKNYDGWESGAGGLHAYFEGDVVDTLELSLLYDVHVMARDQRPFEKAEAKYVSKPEDRRDAITSAWVLVADSQGKLQTLFELDHRASRVSESKRDGKVPAKRKEPREAREAYLSFIQERLALGADALATIWIRQWEEAGKPDLTPYFSFAYPVAPAFILPPEALVPVM